MVDRKGIWLTKIFLQLSPSIFSFGAPDQTCSKTMNKGWFNKNLKLSSSTTTSNSTSHLAVSSHHWNLQYFIAKFAVDLIESCFYLHTAIMPTDVAQQLQ